MLQDQIIFDAQPARPGGGLFRSDPPALGNNVRSASREGAPPISFTEFDDLFLERTENGNREPEIF